MPQRQSAATAAISVGSSITMSLPPAEKARLIMRDDSIVIPTVNFALARKWFNDAEVAKAHLHASVQWLVAHGLEEHDDGVYVMIEDLVDDAYHALMLNTKIYLRFCAEHIGFYIHHTPLDSIDMPTEDVEAGIDYTIEFLQKTYGSELATPLTGWATQRAAGTLKANSVSCIKNGLSDAEQLLLGVRDFHSFWNRDEQPITVQ